jgi:nucleoside-diphosphate-sugar epimerase
MNTRTVLILGANGRLGQAATRAFAEAGWQVLAQARRPLPPGLPSSVRHIALPLTEATALAAAAQGARVLVHAVNPDYTRWDQELLPLARAGMDLAQRLGARFMLPDNVYAFGASMPPLLHEDTPMRPTTAKGRLRLQLLQELAARADGGAQPLRSTVLRAGDFYGSGTGSWLDLVVLKSLRRGKLVSPGPLDLPHAWAYLPDLARAFVALAEVDGLPPMASFHFAGHTLSNRQLLDAAEAAARRLGLVADAPLRRRSLPWALLRLASLVWPMGRELLQMRYLWQVPHALDGRRLAQAVGPLPSTPVDEALLASVQALCPSPLPSTSSALKGNPT